MLAYELRWWYFIELLPLFYFELNGWNSSGDLRAARTVRYTANRRNDTWYLWINYNKKEIAIFVLLAVVGIRRWLAIVALERPHGIP